jgi:miniconductance mechanosensitive channel
MVSLIDQLTVWLQSCGLVPEQAQWMSRALSVAAMVLMAVAANWVAKHLILRAVNSIAKRSSATWDDILVDTGVFTRLSHLAPALVLNAVGPAVLGHNDAALTFLDNATNIYLIIIAVMVLHAVLKAVRLILGRTTRGAQIPIKGFTQAIMLLATLVAGVFILGTLMGKSPVYFLSGIGALTAIIILVFKDAIMGFVAGIQISVNQLVRVGDWIEMPKNGADGDVIDVSLTTVKVRNWDKTITTIPTYSLISDSFKNWRGMSDSGGRRIKRSLLIDMQTVGFADEKLLEHWKQFRLLKPYLEEKLAEIAKENAARGEDLGELGVGRRLTNLGTFRAYCVAYLRAHPRIHQDMTFLVRQLQPTASGLPLEIYVFTNDTRWDIYEGIQSDIFDHLLAVIGQFNLRVFQTPGGHDVSTALNALRGAQSPASLYETH